MGDRKMTNKYTWEEQKKIVKDYFKLIRKKTMTNEEKIEKIGELVRIAEQKQGKTTIDINKLNKILWEEYDISTKS